MSTHDTDPTRREELLFILLHGGAQTESIATRIVDLAIAEAQAEPTPELILLRAESDELKDLRRLMLPQLRREIQHHKDGKARWRGRAEKAEARVAELEKSQAADRAERSRWSDAESIVERARDKGCDQIDTDVLVEALGLDQL
ncbi:hypothetical protein ACIBI8_37300 [Streptomyces sp. NPDC050529]|uniref:hypothetical protein n=1 Tax=Streptomyces sp. NPDC050529 TaxID=3365624 RepID=UPI0037B0C91B